MNGGKNCPTNFMDLNCGLIGQSLPTAMMLKSLSHELRRLLPLYSWCDLRFCTTCQRTH
jgi:hypothetical protein